jgi:hypothetical protein
MDEFDQWPDVIANKCLFSQDDGADSSFRFMKQTCEVIAYVAMNSLLAEHLAGKLGILACRRVHENSSLYLSRHIMPLAVARR